VEEAAEEASAASPAPEPSTAEPAAEPVERVDGAGRTADEVLLDSGPVNVPAVAWHELAAVLRSPVAYAAGAAVIVPTSLLGYLIPLLAGDPVTMDGVFSWAAFGMVFLTPLYTMRLTRPTPVRSWELVAGTWVAGLLLFAAATAFTLVYVALISVYGPGVDSGATVTGYAGLLLVGAAWVALGLLVSSLIESRPVAALAGILVLLAFQYLLGAAAGFLTPPLSDLLQYVSAADHARSFDQGRVVLRDVVYFVTLTAGALLLATGLVESRRWR
jgi:ABC-2 type transport system permease protein